MKQIAIVFFIIAAFAAVCGVGAADEPTKEGAWLVDRSTPQWTQTMEMTLYPRGESRPALQHRLLPDDFDFVDGNAAIYYLKAMGFLCN